jgi:hypothetical protein
MTGRTFYQVTLHSKYHIIECRVDSKEALMEVIRTSTPERDGVDDNYYLRYLKWIGFASEGWDNPYRHLGDWEENMYLSREEITVFCALP